VYSELFAWLLAVDTPVVSTPTLPHNLGSPIQLQKEWRRIHESRLPVRSKMKEAKIPKTQVYANWNKDWRRRSIKGTLGFFKRSSYR